MSGAGRKHRAKHLTSQFLDDTAWTQLRETEAIAICIEAPQNKHVKSLLFFPRDEQTKEQQESQESNEARETHTVNGVCYEVREHLIYLPGKFKKVMWLSVKDVLVVKDLAVVLKPSPKQLSTFYANHPIWEAVLKGVIATVDGMRSAPEKAPQYAKLVTTTTSVLPELSSHGAGSTLLQRAAEEGQQGDIKQQRASEPENEDEKDEEDGIPDLAVNPNRNNIKHRRQFFYYGEENDGEEDDEDGEEEGEDDDDEEEDEEEEKESK